MPIRPQFNTDEEYRLALRSWFAGMALTGFLGMAKGETKLEEVSRSCFEMADAMVLESKNDSKLEEAKK